MKLFTGLSSCIHVAFQIGFKPKYGLKSFEKAMILSYAQPFETNLKYEPKIQIYLLDHFFFRVDTRVVNIKFQDDTWI